MTRFYSSQALQLRVASSCRPTQSAWFCRHALTLHRRSRSFPISLPTPSLARRHSIGSLTICASTWAVFFAHCLANYNLNLVVCTADNCIRIDFLLLCSCAGVFRKSRAGRMRARQAAAPMQQPRPYTAARCKTCMASRRPCAWLRCIRASSPTHRVVSFNSHRSSA